MTDTTPEAVERLARVLDGPFYRVEGYAGPYIDEATLRDEHTAAAATLRAQQAIIARLTADRDAALAQVSAAFEAAADLLDAYSEYDQQYCCNGYMCGCRGVTVHQMMQHFIRALTPADATATLDRIKRQARAEGMRKAAAIYECSPGPDGWDVFSEATRAILAAAEQEERGDE